jgi:hypothetical protein
MNPWKRYKLKVNVARYRLRKLKEESKKNNKIIRIIKNRNDKQILMNLPTQVVDDGGFGNID